MDGLQVAPRAAEGVTETPKFKIIFWSYKTNSRYVEVSSKKGRRKEKETAYINYMDGRHGVVLTTEMFKIKEQNSPDK